MYPTSQKICPLAVICMCISAVTASALSSPLSVFSSHDEWVNQRVKELVSGPHLTGETLTLSCQAFDAKTFWYEGDFNSGATEMPPLFGNLEACTLNLNLTEKFDKDRFICRMADNSKTKTVKLQVIGTPSRLSISRTENDNSSSTATCSSENISSNLKLCWFRNDKRLKCEFSTKGASRSVSIRVPLSAKEVDLTCAPRLGKHSPSLKKEARSAFTNMFKVVQETVKLTDGEIQVSSCSLHANCIECHANDCFWSGRYSRCTADKIPGISDQECPTPSTQPPPSTSKAPVTNNQPTTSESSSKSPNVKKEIAAETPNVSNKITANIIILPIIIIGMTIIIIIVLYRAFLKCSP